MTDIANVIRDMRDTISSMNETILACQDQHPEHAEHWRQMIEAYETAIAVLEQHDHPST